MANKNKYANVNLDKKNYRTFSIIAEIKNENPEYLLNEFLKQYILNNADSLAEMLNKNDFTGIKSE